MFGALFGEEDEEGSTPFVDGTSGGAKKRDYSAAPQVERASHGLAGLDNQ
jgi:hypothetical protein